jgi:uncharacterized protein
MATFSKKPIAAPPPARSSTGAAPALALLSNPYVSAGGAALLLLLLGVLLIALLGDAKAGAPQVRISIAKAAPATPPGWREALAPDHVGELHVTEEVLQLSETPLAPAGDPFGQAVITIPSQGQAATQGGGLVAAPIAGLHADGPSGPLPVLSPDGRSVAQLYARPFTPDGRPKISIIVGGLGLSPKGTRAAIEGLPPEVTLSFVPSTEGLQGWIDLARQHGHEVLLEAPMEPLDYPENDPGPYTLMADARPEELVRKLEWVLSRATGYFGVTNYLGSKFVGSETGMAVFGQALRQRGVAFIDDGSAARRGGGAGRASADKILDEEPSAANIQGQLQSLEGQALAKGQALGAGFAYPVTVSEVARWAATLDGRGYQLAPASALVRR